MQAINRTPSFFGVRGIVTYLEMIWLSTMLTNVGVLYGWSVSMVSFSKEVSINTIHISIYFSQQTTIVFYVIEQCLICLHIESCCPNTHPIRWPKGTTILWVLGEGFSSQNQPFLHTYPLHMLNKLGMQVLTQLLLSFSLSPVVH